jgi:hypothetical protein
MSNPNVDKLASKYANLTERFFDRAQQLITRARSGDITASEIGDATAEALTDGVEALAMPWLLLVNGQIEFNFKPILATVRMDVDSSKIEVTKRTGIRVPAAATLDRSDLVDENGKKIPKTHIEVKASTTDPKDRLVIRLFNLGSVTGAPAGVYRGKVQDTAAGVDLAQLVVKWPG